VTLEVKNNSDRLRVGAEMISFPSLIPQCGVPTTVHRRFNRHESN
jgi:hypothetical protein